MAVISLQRERNTIGKNIMNQSNGHVSEPKKSLILWVLFSIQRFSCRMYLEFDG